MIALLKAPKYSKLTLDTLPRKYTGVEDEIVLDVDTAFAFLRSIQNCTLFLGFREMIGSTGLKNIWGKSTEKRVV